MKLTKEQFYTQTHVEAMKIAQQAIVAEVEGELKKAFDLNEKAFQMEREAALGFSDSNLEPNRSVLLRSAATLAMFCNRFQEAKELIRLALDGNPPLTILEELLTLHADVTKRELAELGRQQKQEMEEFVKTKVKEFNDAVRQARSNLEQREKKVAQVLD